MSFCLWKCYAFLFQILLRLLMVAYSQTSNSFLYNSCLDSGNYSANSTYETNLNTLLSSLPSSVDDYGFNSSSFGQNQDKVNGIALCRGDVNITTCRDCVRMATEKITQTCPNKTQAIAGYDFCSLWYSDETISGMVDDRQFYYAWNIQNVSSKDQLLTDLGTLFSVLRTKASNGGYQKKFAAGSNDVYSKLRIYGYLQCLPDLTKDVCDDCLRVLISGTLDIASGRTGGKAIAPSCILRYETYPFIGSIPPDPTAPPSSIANGKETDPTVPPSSIANGKETGKDGRTDSTTIIVIATSVVGSVIVLTFCIFIFIKKKRHAKPKQPIEKLFAAGEDISIHDMSKSDTLQYDFEIISEATDGFSQTNILGKGGFGAVYKGHLQNGQKIAVKRLFRNSGQGEHEFKNEVILVAKLQHRNLVRLLGLSLEGTERLLIYEFVPNSSLDQFIFDPIKRALLNWDKRSKIISGIAKGLLYLHEDSRLRIIHRDMKASNVLLDSEMLPKIPDFGTARLFVMDETQGSTNRIVGTYGYMAPEYAMHGHFSVKSDVFSFGVLILEIVTGQKNNSYRNGENGENLLSNAWKSWREGTSQSLIDPTLISGSSSLCEMMRCIHIGLLCVQENVDDRPTMTLIIHMLSSSSLTLPLPLRPAFFLKGNMSGISEEKSMSQNEASITQLYPR